MSSFVSRLPSVLAVVLVQGLALLTCGSSLRAQTPGTVDPVFGGASANLVGNVYVVALQSDGKILVGGNLAPSILRLNADGSIDPTFNLAGSLYGGVYTIVIQPDGKILAGSSYGISRFNTDGSFDPTFSATVNGGVQAIAAQPNGAIVIGGSFTQADNAAQANLARLNADGTLDNSFGVTVGGTVSALALQPDGRLIAGGSFNTVDGVSHPGLARLQTDGSLDASFAGEIDDISGSSVSALLLQPDGRLVVGGSFGEVDGSSHALIARLNTDGSIDPGFSSNANGYGILALALQPDGEILAGGESMLFRLNPDGSVDASFTVKSNADVSSVALQTDGTILIGGPFNIVNDVGVSSLARLTTTGQVDTSFVAASASGPNSDVYAMLLQPDGKLVIGGTFSQVQGISHVGIARLNADGSLDPSFAATTNGSVSALALQPDGKLVVGGDFYEVDGATILDVARLNADGSLDAGFSGASPDANVNALALQTDGKILIGGQFDQGNDLGYNFLARLNSDGSVDGTFAANCAYDTSPSIAYGVYALAVQPDGKILVGGNLIGVNGTSESNLFRLNADGSLDPAFSAGVVSPAGGYGASGAGYGLGVGAVSTLLLQTDGRILVGGSFGQVDGVTQANLARLNADGSLDATFVPDLESPVVASVLQSDGQIILGLNSFMQGGSLYRTLTRLKPDGSVDPFFNPGGSGPNESVNALVLESDGKIFVGGDFTSIDGALRNYVARLNGGGSPDFFNGGVSVGNGFYYLQFPNGTPFGYYNLSGNGYQYPYFFHADLGMEYFFDANDGKAGAYMYDFKSSTFFYSSPTFPWPYLYDFSLNTVLYYYPDPNNPGHYNTNGVRYFYDFAAGTIITK